MLYCYFLRASEFKKNDCVFALFHTFRRTLLSTCLSAPAYALSDQFSVVSNFKSFDLRSQSKSLSICQDRFLLLIFDADL